MDDRVKQVLADLPPFPPVQQGVFCNRTLNLRAIRAIGYDMDYTLIHYHVIEWEHRAYSHLRKRLASLGWPVSALAFDPSFIIRGLAIDTELGNIVKANRFGYVKRAYHGLSPLDFEAQRDAYARTVVDLSEDRWIFLNTLFSLSEGCMYAQLVELLDRKKLLGVWGYADLYRKVKSALDEAHMEGRLKSEILADPERFVEQDPTTAQALLDQKAAGKKLLLITNSDWTYTRDIMAYAFDQLLPGSMTWRELFDLIIVSARKPAFFYRHSPIFEVVDDEGLLRPCVHGITAPGAYLGGNARLVEKFLRRRGSDILYVGDHAYGDVHQSKSVRRWRTGLILRELEDELEALASFAPEQQVLSELMAEKDRLEFQLAQLRLAVERAEQPDPSPDLAPADTLRGAYAALRQQIETLDEQIAPHAVAAGRLVNAHWGPPLRTGNDKSLLARHVERHADVYTSRVSNFQRVTPYAYLRSPRGSLPHDPLPER